MNKYSESLRAMKIVSVLGSGVVTLAVVATLMLNALGAPQETAVDTVEIARANPATATPVPTATTPARATTVTQRPGVVATPTPAATRAATPTVTAPKATPQVQVAPQPRTRTRKS